MAWIPAASLQLDVDASALQAAIDSLAELGKRSPQTVQGFLDSGDPLAQVVGFDADELAAVRAGNLRVALEPSDGLVQFLAAFRAGDRNAL